MATNEQPAGAAAGSTDWPARLTRHLTSDQHIVGCVLALVGVALWGLLRVVRSTTPWPLEPAFAAALYGIGVIGTKRRGRATSPPPQPSAEQPPKDPILPGSPTTERQIASFLYINKDLVHTHHALHDVHRISSLTDSTNRGTNQAGEIKIGPIVIKLGREILTGRGIQHAPPEGTVWDFLLLYAKLLETSKLHSQSASEVQDVRTLTEHGLWEFSVSRLTGVVANQTAMVEGTARHDCTIRADLQLNYLRGEWATGSASQIKGRAIFVGRAVSYKHEYEVPLEVSLEVIAVFR